MSDLVVKLEELNPDLRSNEVTYRFTIQNDGTERVTVTDIELQTPDGVRVNELKGSISEEKRSQAFKICRELSDIISEKISGEASGKENKLSQAISENIGDIVSRPGTLIEAVVGIVGRAIFGGAISRSIIAATAETVVNRAQAPLRIDDSQDAEDAFNRFFVKDEDKQTISAQLFCAKLQKLKKIEKALGLVEGQGIPYIVTIEPQSVFNRPYTMSFKRRLFDPAKFDFQINLEYTKGNDNKILMDGAAASFIISPNPIVLSLIAMVSAVVGNLLLLAQNVVTSAQGAEDHLAFWRAFWINMIGPGISSVFVALLFFNIYEFTNLGDKFRMKISWRAAMLIGVLCGLLGDRTLRSVMTFFGPTQ